MRPRTASSKPIAALAVTAATVLLQGGCATRGTGAVQVVRVETPDSRRQTASSATNWAGGPCPERPERRRSACPRNPCSVLCRAPNMTSSSVAAPASRGDDRSPAGMVTGGLVGAAAIGPLVAPALLFTPAAPLVLAVVATGAGAGMLAGALVDVASASHLYPATVSVQLACVPRSTGLRPACRRRGRHGDPRADGRRGNRRRRRRPDAVMVARLAPDGRAARAGLREFDLIVRCNDADIVDAAQLEAIVRATGRRSRSDSRCCATVDPSISRCRSGSRRAISTPGATAVRTATAGRSHRGARRGLRSLHEGKLDPARFPRAPATVLAGAATEFAIVADAALAQAVYRPEGKGSGTPRITVPIGPIVEAARSPRWRTSSGVPSRPTPARRRQRRPTCPHAR